MIWPWTKIKYAEGAEKITGYQYAEDLRKALPCPVAQFYNNDVNLLSLREDAIKDLAFKYVKMSGLSYHGNSEEFPDCDDFAWRARSQMMFGAANEGLEYPIGFAFLDYSDKIIGQHAVNIVRVAGGKFLLYDPQTGVFRKDMSNLKMVRMVVA